MRQLSTRKKITVGVLSFGALSIFGLVALFIFEPWYFVGALLLFRDKNYWTTDGCARVIQGSIAAPDGQMEAKVFHVHCGPIFVGSAGWDILALTFVKRGDEPSRYVTAMEVNLGEGGNTLVPWNPSMVWKNASELQVRLPEDVEVWLKRPPVAGINIEIERETGKPVRQFSEN